MKPVGTGALFGKDAKSEFLRLTGSRYDGMKVRNEKKKLPPLSFGKEAFRTLVLHRFLNGNYDGAIQCPYCRKVCTLQEVAADHEIPLSRGGSSDLENIGFPCSNCNAQKGSMTPAEFHTLLACLERMPFARIDVLKRLQQSVKLAAGLRRSIMLSKKASEKKKDEEEPF